MRTWILGIASVLAVMGAALIVQSNTLPEWTDRAKMEEVATDYPPSFNGPVYDEHNKRWHKRMRALRTAKWPLYDLGSGLIALSLSLAAGTIILKVRTGRDIAALRTPKRRMAILGMCTIAWIWFGLAFSYEVLQDQERFMFPPWADTIIIPIAGICAFTLFGLVLLVPLAWIVALRRARLPISFWAWRPDYPITSWAFSVCAAITALFGGIALCSALAAGPYVMVPATLLWVYGVLAVRAAALSQLPEAVNSPQTV